MAYITGAVLGFLASFASFLAVEYFKKPRLIFSIDNGAIAQRTDGVVYRIVSLRVKNTKRPSLLRAFDQTANNARCFVAFSDPSDNHELKSVNGRWASGREPYDYIAEKVDLGAVLIPQREVIPPNEDGVVNVAVKFEGEDHFYAFNNESYAPGDDGGAWRHTKLRFGQDHLLVTVEVLTEGHRVKSRNFLLRNPNASVDNFEVSEVKKTRLPE